MDSKNADRFLGFATTYENTRPTLPIHTIELIKSYLSTSIDTVVDLGCGTGLSTLVWKNHAKHIIGIEPSKDMLEIASQKANDYISFILGSGENIPLESESADVVICCQSFHWMHPQHTLQEVNRVLKPNGVFIAIDYDWPPVMKLKAEQAYWTFKKQIRSLPTLQKENQDGYPKSQHIQNMKDSDSFQYVREIVFSNIEAFNVERLIQMFVSVSSVQQALKHHPLETKVYIEQLQDTLFDIYPETFTIELCYRMKVGIK